MSRTFATRERFRFAPAAGTFGLVTASGSLGPSMSVAVEQEGRDVVQTGLRALTVGVTSAHGGDLLTVERWLIQWCGAELEEGSMPRRGVGQLVASTARV